MTLVSSVLLCSLLCVARTRTIHEVTRSRTNKPLPFVDLRGSFWLGKEIFQNRTPLARGQHRKLTTCATFVLSEGTPMMNDFDDEPDQEKRIEKLRAQLGKLGGEVSDNPDLSADLEEEFLKHILAFETAESSTLLQWLENA